MARHSARSALAVLAAGAALVTAGCSAGNSPPQNSSSQQSADTATPGPADTSRDSGSSDTGATPNSPPGNTGDPGPSATSGSPGGETSGTPWCTTSALSPAFRSLESAAGSRYTALVLSNTSGAACRTQGWPGLQLADADGKPLPTDAVRDRTRSPRPLTLEPGGRAWSRLHWSVVAGEEDPADGRCPVPAAVRVTPPDQRTPDSTGWGGLGTVCGGGRIDVLPLSPGGGPEH